MIFISPALLPRFPDHLWTEALLISKAIAVSYKQASVHTYHFSVSLVTTQPNARVAQLNTRS